MVNVMRIFPQFFKKRHHLSLFFLLLLLNENMVSKCLPSLNPSCVFDSPVPWGLQPQSLPFPSLLSILFLLDPSSYLQMMLTAGDPIVNMSRLPPFHGSFPCHTFLPFIPKIWQLISPLFLPRRSFVLSHQWGVARNSTALLVSYQSRRFSWNLHILTQPTLFCTFHTRRSWVYTGFQPDILTSYFRIKRESSFIIQDNLCVEVWWDRINL